MTMGNGLLQSEMLPGCSARVDADGVARGTGIFVTAMEVITCRHVIDNAATVVVRDRSGVSRAADEIRSAPGGLDVAWISLAAPMTRTRVALLGEAAETGDELYSFGYPEGSAAGEPATFEIEGLTGDVPPRMKFKAGQVKPGMSGSPLLNMRTGAVCAILVSTRGRQSSLGGYGLPVATIFACPGFGELSDLNAAANIDDPQWAAATMASEGVLNATSEDAGHADSLTVITKVSGSARVGKIVNIGDVGGSVTF
jgi:Trypsin-like peptidase domain